MGEANRGGVNTGVRRRKKRIEVSRKEFRWSSKQFRWSRRQSARRRRKIFGVQVGNTWGRSDFLRLGGLEASSGGVGEASPPQAKNFLEPGGVEANSGGVGANSGSPSPQKKIPPAASFL